MNYRSFYDSNYHLSEYAVDEQVDCREDDYNTFSRPSIGSNSGIDVEGWGYDTMFTNHHQPRPNPQQLNMSPTGELSGNTFGMTENKQDEVSPNIANQSTISTSNQVSTTYSTLVKQSQHQNGSSPIDQPFLVSPSETASSVDHLDTIVSSSSRFTSSHPHTPTNTPKYQSMNKSSQDSSRRTLPIHSHGSFPDSGSEGSDNDIIDVYGLPMKELIGESVRYIDPSMADSVLTALEVGSPNIPKNIPPCESQHLHLPSAVDGEDTVSRQHSGGDTRFQNLRNTEASQSNSASNATSTATSSNLSSSNNVTSITTTSISTSTSQRDQSIVNASTNLANPSCHTSPSSTHSSSPSRSPTAASAGTATTVASAASPASAAAAASALDNAPIAVFSALAAFKQFPVFSSPTAFASTGNTTTNLSSTTTTRNTQAAQASSNGSGNKRGQASNLTSTITSPVVDVDVDHGGQYPSLPGFSYTSVPSISEFNDPDPVTGAPPAISPHSWLIDSAMYRILEAFSHCRCTINDLGPGRTARLLSSFSNLIQRVKKLEDKLENTRALNTANASAHAPSKSNKSKLHSILTSSSIHKQDTSTSATTPGLGIGFGLSSTLETKKDSKTAGKMGNTATPSSTGVNTNTNAGGDASPAAMLNLDSRSLNAVLVFVSSSEDLLNEYCDLARLIFCHTIKAHINSLVRFLEQGGELRLISTQRDIVNAISTFDPSLAILQESDPIVLSWIKAKHVHMLYSTLGVAVSTGPNSGTANPISINSATSLSTISTPSTTVSNSRFYQHRSLLGRLTFTPVLPRAILTVMTQALNDMSKLCEPESIDIDTSSFTLAIPSVPSPSSVDSSKIDAKNPIVTYSSSPKHYHTALVRHLCYGIQINAPAWLVPLTMRYPVPISSSQPVPTNTNGNSSFDTHSSSPSDFTSATSESSTGILMRPYIPATMQRSSVLPSSIGSNSSRSPRSPVLPSTPSSLSLSMSMSPISMYSAPGSTIMPGISLLSPSNLSYTSSTGTLATSHFPSTMNMKIIGNNTHTQSQSQTRTNIETGGNANASTLVDSSSLSRHDSSLTLSTASTSASTSTTASTSAAHTHPDVDTEKIDKNNQMLDSKTKVNITEIADDSRVGTLEAKEKQNQNQKQREIETNNTSTTSPSLSPTPSKPTIRTVFSRFFKREASRKSVKNEKSETTEDGVEKVDDTDVNGNIDNHRHVNDIGEINVEEADEDNYLNSAEAEEIRKVAKDNSKKQLTSVSRASKTTTAKFTHPPLHTDTMPASAHTSSNDWSRESEADVMTDWSYTGSILDSLSDLSAKESSENRSQQAREHNHNSGYDSPKSPTKKNATRPQSSLSTMSTISSVPTSSSFSPTMSNQHSSAFGTSSSSPRLGKNAATTGSTAASTTTSASATSTNIPHSPVLPPRSHIRFKDDPVLFALFQAVFKSLGTASTALLSLAPSSVNSISLTPSRFVETKMTLSSDPQVSSHLRRLSLTVSSILSPSVTITSPQTILANEAIVAKDGLSAVITSKSAITPSSAPVASSLDAAKTSSIKVCIGMKPFFRAPRTDAFTDNSHSNEEKKLDLKEAQKEHENEDEENEDDKNSTEDEDDNEDDDEDESIGDKKLSSSINTSFSRLRRHLRRYDGIVHISPSNSPIDFYFGLSQLPSIAAVSTKHAFILTGVEKMLKLPLGSLRSVAPFSSYLDSRANSPTLLTALRSIIFSSRVKTQQILRQHRKEERGVIRQRRRIQRQETIRQRLLSLANTPHQSQSEVEFKSKPKVESEKIFRGQEQRKKCSISQDDAGCADNETGTHTGEESDTPSFSSFDITTSLADGNIEQSPPLRTNLQVECDTRIAWNATTLARASRTRSAAVKVDQVRDTTSRRMSGEMRREIESMINSTSAHVLDKNSDNNNSTQQLTTKTDAQNERLQEQKLETLTNTNTNLPTTKGCVSKITKSSCFTEPKTNPSLISTHRNLMSPRALFLKTLDFCRPNKNFQNSFMMNYHTVLSPPQLLHCLLFYYTRPEVFFLDVAMDPEVDRVLGASFKATGVRFYPFPFARPASACCSSKPITSSPSDQGTNEHNVVYRPGLKQSGSPKNESTQPLITATTSSNTTLSLDSIHPYSLLSRIIDHVSEWTANGNDMLSLSSSDDLVFSLPMRRIVVTRPDGAVVAITTTHLRDLRLQIASILVSWASSAFRRAWTTDMASLLQAFVQTLCPVDDLATLMLSSIVPHVVDSANKVALAINNAPLSGFSWISPPDAGSVGGYADPNKETEPLPAFSSLGQNLNPPALPYTVAECQQLRKLLLQTYGADISHTVVLGGGVGTNPKTLNTSNTSNIANTANIPSTSTTTNTVKGTSEMGSNENSTPSPPAAAASSGASTASTVGKRQYRFSICGDYEYMLLNTTAESDFLEAQKQYFDTMVAQQVQVQMQMQSQLEAQFPLQSQDPNQIPMAVSLPRTENITASSYAMNMPMGASLPLGGVSLPTGSLPFGMSFPLGMPMNMSMNTPLSMPMNMPLSVAFATQTPAQAQALAFAESQQQRGKNATRGFIEPDLSSPISSTSSHSSFECISLPSYSNPVFPSSALPTSSFLPGGGVFNTDNNNNNHSLPQMQLQSRAENPSQIVHGGVSEQYHANPMNTTEDYGAVMQLQTPSFGPMLMSPYPVASSLPTLDRDAMSSTQLQSSTLPPMPMPMSMPPLFMPMLPPFPSPVVGTIPANPVQSPFLSYPIEVLTLISKIIPPIPTLRGSIENERKIFTALTPLEFAIRCTEYALFVSKFLQLLGIRIEILSQIEQDVNLPSNCDSSQVDDGIHNQALDKNKDNQKDKPLVSQSDSFHSDDKDTANIDGTDGTGDISSDLSDSDWAVGPQDNGIGDVINFHSNSRVETPPTPSEVDDKITDINSLSQPRTRSGLGLALASLSIANSSLGSSPIPFATNSTPTLPLPSSSPSPVTAQRLLGTPISSPSRSSRSPQNHYQERQLQIASVSPNGIAMHYHKTALLSPAAPDSTSDTSALSASVSFSDASVRSTLSSPPPVDKEEILVPSTTSMVSTSTSQNNSYNTALAVGTSEQVSVMPVSIPTFPLSMPFMTSSMPNYLPLPFPPYPTTALGYAPDYSSHSLYPPLPPIAQPPLLTLSRPLSALPTEVSTGFPKFISAHDILALQILDSPNFSGSFSGLKLEHKRHQSALVRSASPFHFYPFSISKSSEFLRLANDLLKRPPPRGFPIHAVNSKLVVDQLTIISQSLFRRVTPADLSEKRASTNRSEPLTNSVSVVIQHFNHISFWVANEILQKKDTRQQCMTCEYFIDIARLCLTTHYNFHILFAVSAALTSTPIYRLKGLRSALSSTYHQHMNNIIKVTSASDNFAAYRPLLEKAYNERRPVIPYLGVILKDITFMSEPSPIEVKTKQVNIQRIHNLAAEMTRFFAFRELPYKVLHVSQSVLLAPSIGKGIREGREGREGRENPIGEVNGLNMSGIISPDIFSTSPGGGSGGTFSRGKPPINGMLGESSRATVSSGLGTLSRTKGFGTSGLGTSAGNMSSLTVSSSTLAAALVAGVHPSSSLSTSDFSPGQLEQMFISGAVRAIEEEELAKSKMNAGFVTTVDSAMTIGSTTGTVGISTMSDTHGVSSGGELMTRGRSGTYTESTTYNASFMEGRNTNGDQGVENNTSITSTSNPRSSPFKTLIQRKQANGTNLEPIQHDVGETEKDESNAASSTTKRWFFSRKAVVVNEAKETKQVNKPERARFQELRLIALPGVQLEICHHMVYAMLMISDQSSLLTKSLSVEPKMTNKEFGAVMGVKALLEEGLI